MNNEPGIEGSPISPYLENRGFVLLDGGLATELEKLGHDLDNTLWSASLIDNHSADICRVHLDYLEAGADCITSASYQASVPGLVGAGYSQAQACSLIRKSVDIACEARSQYLAGTVGQPELKPLVAASIGPYGASLADGSEYTGNYSASDRDLRSFHESRWEILLNSPADLFAIETIPSVREAEILHDLLLASPDLFAWISFSCADEHHVNDGTPLSECAALFAHCPQVIAIGINCTPPRHIASLINQVKMAAPGKPVVVYPNSGELYEAGNNTWRCDPDEINFGKAAVQWFNLGARLLGGCCRTGPGDISAMQRSLGNIS